MKLDNIFGLQTPNFYGYPAIKLIVKVDNNWTDNKLQQVKKGVASFFSVLKIEEGKLNKIKKVTNLGQLIKVVAINLLILIGQEVKSGTIKNNSKTLEVIFEFETENTALLAGRLAVEVIKSLKKGLELNPHQLIAKLKKLEQKYSLSDNAKLLIKTAQQENIPTIKLDSKSDLFQLGYGKYSTIFQGLISEKSSDFATTKLLSDLNIPVVDKKEVAIANYKLLIIDNQLEVVMEILANGSKRKINKDINPSTKQLLLNLARIYGWQIVEVSIISSNLAIPLDQAGQIINIDLNPKLTTYNSILDLNKLSKKVIACCQPARIPIISVAGTNNSLAIKLVNSILETAGVKTGVYLNNTTYTNNQALFSTQSKTRPDFNLILQDKEVETIITELNSTDLKKESLEYDYSNVAVITKLKTEREIKFVSSLLLKRVIADGWTILNADDQKVIEVINRVQIDRIICCSLARENIIVQKRIAANSPVVFIKNNNLVLFDGTDELPLISLNKLPNSFKEKPKLLRGILFAIAVTFAFDIPIFVIRTILLNLDDELIEKNNDLSLTFDVGL